ncbi:hypothetical protein NC652_020006 [Populus alba x Populus x berolinensis]|nr:hypothetical protein NC652_020006 [Populus alba x Populus x berolinensis]
MAAKAGAAASFMFMLFLLNIACHAQLSPTFYDSSCPNALSAIRTAIRSAIASDRRMAASLIRLGCDASILLDETPSIQSEKTALGNLNSARAHLSLLCSSAPGYNVIDKAQTEVEKICPGVVSCADIIAVAARDASAFVSISKSISLLLLVLRAAKPGLVVYDSYGKNVTGGCPSYAVKLGRRDSTTASRTLANAELPAFFESLGVLFLVSKRKGLTARDMVAFDSTLAPLDLVTPNSFDNNYFKNLMQHKGLLQSDQVLFTGGSTDSIVSEYSRNPARFKSDFGSAMIKMGDIGLLTGSSGQIRRICSAVN